MLSSQGLIDFFGLKAPANARVVSVYAPNVSERLRYISHFIFQHGLSLNFRLLTTVSEFEEAGGPKVNYSLSQLNSGVWIKPSGLLEEKGIQPKKPELHKGLGSIPHFYKTPEAIVGAFHFDIFSAVFFLVSRYEEWQDFEKDKHDRFEAAQSILVKYQLHQKPLVEYWLKELAEALCQQQTDLKIAARPFRVLSTIDVDNLFAYKAKGWLRTVGAIGKDVLKRDWINLKGRLTVLTGKQKDPFDIYEAVSDFCFEQKIPLIYFFLYRTGTKFDRTVDPRSPAFAAVFEAVRRNHAAMGIHPSYDASVNAGLLQKELDLLSKTSAQKIEFSRQHFLRYNIRTTPQDLIKNGIKVDFSMGFASEQGLRAGTTIPFYYYDFAKEKALDLLLVPFCTMDGVYTIYHAVQAEMAFREMMNLAQEIKRCGGNFISVFHERSFSDHLYPGFGSLYKKLHITLKGE